MASVYIILLPFLHTSFATCTQAYGGKPCTYVPAPPGHTPPCARPGLTYCEHPYHYPSQTIKSLLEKWKYDHSTLIVNESQEEFNAYYVPQVEYKTHGYTGYMYSYPYDISNANGEKLHPESSYFPYPDRNVSNFGPSPGYFDQQYKKYPQKNYPYGYNPKYSTNILQYPNAPGLYQRGRDPFPNGSLQNNWWKRYGNHEVKKYHLFRRRRAILAQNDAYLSQKSSNGTKHVRTKRQTLGSSQQLCQARSNYIMPRAALNNKGNWMYVVNMPDANTAQLVKSETCISQQCSGLCSLPIGATSRCEQKYIQKRLVALEGGGDQLYQDLFWIPSCCVCTISN